MVDPDNPTVPQVEVVKPAAEPVVDGGDHDAGTATVNSPFDTVVAAVYVNVSVLPVEPATALAGATVIVPVPSSPTVITGEVPTLVSVPLDQVLVCVVNVYGPFWDGAVTPALKPLIPYLIRHVAPPFRKTPLVVIRCP